MNYENMENWRYMMKHIKSAFFVILLSAARLHAQEAVSLDTVLSIADRVSPEVKAYYRLMESQDVLIEGANAWMAPMVGAGKFMSPYPWKGSLHDEQRGSWMLSAEQTLLNPAKARARKEYLSAQSAITLTEQTSFRNELRSKVRQLYLALVVSEKKLMYQRENMRIVQTMRKLAEIRYPFNQGSLGQVFKSEGRLYETENMILMTESEIRSRKSALNVLMYKPAGAEIRIDTNARLDYVPAVSLDTGNLANISEIQAMSLQINSVLLEAKQMRAELKPDLSIRYEHMATRSSMMPNQYNLMAMLSIPIAPWSAKMQRSGIRSMELQRESMRLRRDNMLNERAGMAYSLASEIVAVQRILENQQNKIIPALKKNLNVTMLSYQENKESLNMVLDAWEALNMAQMTHLDQLANYYDTIVEYEKNLEK